MIVIYTQDNTIIRKDADEAKADLRKARRGASYQRYGGPLVQVVSSEKASWIRKKEKEVTTVVE